MEILELLESRGAVLRDTHVVYTSGRHGSAYINKDALYPDTAVISRICAALAEPFQGKDVEVVAGPAIGGVILAQWTAHHLAQAGPPVLAVYAEKEPTGGLRFRRGYGDLVQGRRTLVVEDILTTGGSLRDVCAAVREAGGHLVGAAAICNRGGVTAADVGEPPELVVLADVRLDSWEEGECPLCARGAPINTEVGKGKEFLQRKGASA